MTPAASRGFSHLVVPGLRMWFLVLMSPSLTRLDPFHREGPKHSVLCLYQSRCPEDVCRGAGLWAGLLKVTEGREQSVS